MALMITEDCTSCGACEPECPNQAISEKRKIGYYWINPDCCTECVGFHAEPQCVAVCPVDVCVPDPKQRESRAELLAKKERLHSAGA